MNFRKKILDVLVIGFALFAMFFGAGNLIFPPFLGMETAHNWPLAFLCYFIADVGLALLAVYAMVRFEDVSIDSITQVLGKKASILLNTLVVLCIGPLLALPRTAATTFEMAIMPFFPTTNSWIFGAIFFALTLFLTLRPSGAVDIVGKYLTPCLVVCLLVLIILGILDPIGPIITTESAHAVSEGILAGYQTMDVLAAMIFISLAVSAAQKKGYYGKDTSSVVLLAGLVSAAALFIIYGGLCYLGATASSQAHWYTTPTTLTVAVTQAIAGHYGVLLLAIIVTFACLTTSIGLTSACAGYFSHLSGNKVSEPICVIIIVVFSYVVSNFGISTIIQFSSPILSILYPVVIVLILLSFFRKYIKQVAVYRICALVVLLISAATTLLG